MKGFLSTPSGWDDGYQAAKAAAGRRPLRLQVFGDSIAAGYTTSFAGSFVEQAVALLRGRHGSYGDFWTNVFGFDTPDFVKGAGWSGALNGNTMATASAKEGYGPWWFANGVTTNAAQSFTTPDPCTAFDLIYYDAFAAAASTWQYSLDGAANVTVTNAADSTVKRIAFSGLANARHTVSWGWQSVNGGACIMGAATYTGSGHGLAVGRMGAAGTQLADFQSPANLKGSVFPLGADLAIIALATNDIAQAAAGSEGYLYGLCRAVRANNPNASLLFVIPSYPLPSVDDCNHSFANPGTAYTYHDMLYRAAARFDGALIDINRKWAGQGHALGFLPAADIHPTQAGQDDIAGVLLPLL